MDKINLNLDTLTANFEDLSKTAKFLGDKYDELLRQVNRTNVKLNQQSQCIDAAMVELGKVKKCAIDAKSTNEDISL